MANKFAGLKLPGKGGKHGRMPTKTSINLAKIEVKKTKVGIAIPAIILIIILAGVFSKYLVIDRFAERDAAFAEVVRLRNQLDSLNIALEKYRDVEDVYAHYTKAAMTPEELGLVDRVLVVELVRNVLPESKGAKTWSVSGNILTIDVAESSLGKQNELTKKIEESPIVDSCTITRANKDNNKEKNEEVRAILTVYLQQPEEEETASEESKAETSDTDNTSSDDSSKDSSADREKDSADTSSADSANGSGDTSSVESAKDTSDTSAAESSENPANASSGDSLAASSGASVNSPSENSGAGSSGSSAGESESSLTTESAKTSAGESAQSAKEGSV